MGWPRGYARYRQRSVPARRSLASTPRSPRGRWAYRVHGSAACHRECTQRRRGNALCEGIHGVGRLSDDLPARLLDLIHTSDVVLLSGESRYQLECTFSLNVPLAFWQRKKALSLFVDGIKRLAPGLPVIHLSLIRPHTGPSEPTPLHAIAPLLLASQAPPELKEQRGEPGDRRHVIVDSLIGLRHLQHQLIRFLLKIRVVAAILHKLT